VAKPANPSALRLVFRPSPCGILSVADQADPPPP
jgi:hypothetical protein